MIIPPGYMALFAQYRNAVGHACQNVVGYALSDTIIDADLDAASTDLAAVYKAQLNSGGAYLGLRALIGQDGGDPLVAVSTVDSGPGARSGAIQAPQVQGLIKKTTALSGRRGTGRLFIPDMVESQVDDDGTVNSTGLGLLNDIGQVWLVGVPGSSGAIGDPVILHSDSTTPTVINNFSAEVLVATQRRRFPRT